VDLLDDDRVNEGGAARSLSLLRGVPKGVARAAHNCAMAPPAWLRLGAAVSCVATCSHALSPTKLMPNKAGSPLEIGRNTTDLCKGRTHRHHECSILLDVPQQCAGEQSSCPVAFFLHGEGEGETGKEFARGMHEASSVLHGANWIGVYPTGDGEWNTDGDTCKYDDYTCKADNNEVEFVISIIDFIAGIGAFNSWQPKLGAPPKGTPGLFVYGTGTGAALAQKLAANAGARLPIKGIWADGAQLLQAPPRSGPGDLNYNQPGVKGGKHESLPVAQVASHGTKDTVYPFAGGAAKTHLNCSACKLMSEASSNAAWAKHNGCNMSKATVDKTVNATYGVVSATTGHASKTTATVHSFQYAQQAHRRRRTRCACSLTLGYI
jgi:poly(3-hydroxybutyrate) depolymerase